MKKSFQICLTFISLACLIDSNVTAQSIEFGTNLQVYSSSPNRLYKVPFIPNILDKSQYTTNIAFNNSLSYTAWLSIIKAINEKWGNHFNTSYE